MYYIKSDCYRFVRDKRNARRSHVVCKHAVRRLNPKSTIRAILFGQPKFPARFSSRRIRVV